MKKNTEVSTKSHITGQIDTERIDRLDRMQSELEGRHDAAYNHHYDELARRAQLAQGELGHKAIGLELIVSEPPVKATTESVIASADQEEAA